MSTDRVLLSHGSQAANAHALAHRAAAAGRSAQHQQYHALMHENGAIDADPAELAAYVRDLRVAPGTQEATP